MTTTSMTKQQATEILEKAIGESILGEADCGWKDHWQHITEDPSADLAAAIQLLLGKTPSECSPYDVDFTVAIGITLNEPK